MIYSGSIIFIEPDNLEEVKTLLEGFEGVDIHAVSDDKRQIVVSIETDDDDSLDTMTKKLKSYEPIVDVGHHIMHFEDEVEDILDGKKIPDITKFQKSKRRKNNPLEIINQEQV